MTCSPRKMKRKQGSNRSSKSRNHENLKEKKYRIRAMQVTRLNPMVERQKLGWNSNLLNYKLGKKTDRHASRSISKAHKFITLHTMTNRYTSTPGLKSYLLKNLALKKGQCTIVCLLYYTAGRRYHARRL